MKKSVIIPIVFSLIIIGANLYAQSNADEANDSLVLLSKKVTLPIVKTASEKQSEPEKFVEFSLEDIDEVSPYKVVVYDIEGNEVFSLSSDSKVAFDKVPVNANLLMKEGKTSFYILDKRNQFETKQ